MTVANAVVVTRLLSNVLVNGRQFVCMMKEIAVSLSV